MSVSGRTETRKGQIEMAKLDGSTWPFRGRFFPGVLLSAILASPTPENIVQRHFFLLTRTGNSSSEAPELFRFSIRIYRAGRPISRTRSSVPSFPFPLIKLFKGERRNPSWIFLSLSVSTRKNSFSVVTCQSENAPVPAVIKNIDVVETGFLTRTNQ